MVERPDKKRGARATRYDELDIETGVLPAIFQTFVVGHLLATDLDRVCRPHGLSIADINLIGAMRFERSKQLRAADLAQTLRVSNAVLSTRIAKLERAGFLVRTPSATDKRAFMLKLTPKGEATIESVLVGISEQAAFVRAYKRLNEADQKALVRILGQLQKRMD